MEEEQFCRICLQMDVKMQCLQSYPLELSYKLLLGNNVLSFGLPTVVCNECASLLKKCFLFSEKCIKSQTVLNTLVEKYGKISRDILKNIDNVPILSANLDKRKINSIDIEPPTEEKDHKIYYDKEEIKVEPIDVSESGDYDDKDSIKLEDSGDDNSLLSSDDDDDEPLSVHKVKKEGKKEKKVKQQSQDKKLKVSSENEDPVKLLMELQEATEATEVEVQVKRKRGRPKKMEGPKRKKKAPAPTRRTKNTGGVKEDDIDLEQFCNIIILTEEQQKEEIIQRQESSNYKNALYKCSLCYKGFIDDDAWKHHLSKHDPSTGPVECAVCRFRFPSKRQLQKHVTNHERKYACKACPYVSKSPTQAKQHQRWHKGVTYKCQYCEEVLAKWTSYLSHVRIKHPSQHICGVCGYSFVSQLGLNMHRTMMHKDVESQEADKAEGSAQTQALYCAQCDVQFAGQEAYKRHMVTSARHAESAHINNGCRACGEWFPDAEALRVHHRRQHAKPRPRNYGKRPAAHAWPTTCAQQRLLRVRRVRQQHAKPRPRNYGKRPAAHAWPATCAQCDVEVSNAREYWTHFRRAHPDHTYPIQKNYVCDVCGKSFRGNAFLVYHKRTHTEERAFKCSQCPKAFHNRMNLHMHERTHSELRAYPCSVCNKAFKCKGALDRHFRSHTGIKPYECEVCGKAFAQSNSRKLHVRTVHLKQPSPYISRARLERRHRAAPAPQPPPALY